MNAVDRTRGLWGRWIGKVAGWADRPIRVVGLENVPRKGPAVLAFNHTSSRDGNLILSLLARPVRFVLNGPSEGELAWWRGEAADAIVLRDGKSEPLEAASEALEEGDLVAIFPEGAISRTGFLLPFRKDLEGLLDRNPGVPIVPAYIDRRWRPGSGTSVDGRGWAGRALTVRFGKPMPSGSSAWRVREAVQLLGAECSELRKEDRTPLHRQFVRQARKDPGRPCMADSSTPMQSFGQALLRSVVLSRLLGRALGPEQYVGLLLPPSVGAALANVALSFLGKVPVNLNYTLGTSVLDDCIRQCGMRQIITSRRLLEKIDLRPKAEILFLEDLRGQVRSGDKVLGMLARILPAWVTEHLLLGLGGHTMDDQATVIFSSGSTGSPKGVVLTQHNIVSNIESIVQVTDATRGDLVMGVLPFFHSFGYTVTLWLPALLGASAVYHFSPLDAELVGRLIREHQATIFVSTATFLRGHLRKSEREDFRSLRLLVCGAEKLPAAVADECERRLGIWPLEGYGCTELSPAVAVNRPDALPGGPRQVGHKPGTIGHPMPGQAVQVVDPQTLHPLPIGQEGLLLVKGANVMKGYLNRPELSAEAIQDGWYVTGDVARLDADGFITLTDRLSRFSKIGGEMVPHGKVEDVIHEVLGTAERVCAVVGVPDPRRGERLVVLHTPWPETLDRVWQAIKERGLPPLWLPAKTSFFQVSALPVLGTGKLDLAAVKRIALERAAGEGSPDVQRRAG